jgi:hypothetical protein
MTRPLSLCANHVSARFRSGCSGAYEVAAFIQAISALLIPRSLPANELMTVIEPVRKLVIATAKVTDNTNNHS